MEVIKNLETAIEALIQSYGKIEDWKAIFSEFVEEEEY